MLVRLCAAGIGTGPSHESGHGVSQHVVPQAALHNSRFAADSSRNDMWLLIQLEDLTSEVKAVEDVRAHLARHYSPFSKIKVDVHCES